MPPRFAYWTILVGGLPTAFRAAQREEIEPTFRRLREKHPDAEMRWFARGKLWASPEEAREVSERQKAKGQRPKFADRDRSWRPGGSHRDPRQPYIDAKKRENQKRRERRFEIKKKGSGLPASGFRPSEERPKWKPRPDRWDRPPQDSRPGTGDPRPESKGPAPKAWDRPKPKWGKPGGYQGQRPKAKGQRPNENQRPWEQRPKWKRPLGEERPEGEQPWKPKPWRPKTEDRRPKTEGGRGPGRTGWGAGARKGPGKGRRK